MTDSPTPDPTEPAPDPLAEAAAAPPGPAWDDPVEAQGAAFARQADDDLDERARLTPGTADDLSPDFLAPEQPA